MSSVGGTKAPPPFPHWARRKGKRTYITHQLTDFGTGENDKATAFTPFIARDATSIILRGELDLEVAKEALKDEGLFPVIGPNGTAVGTLMVNALRKSVVDHPYNEIIFMIDAHTKPEVKTRGFKSGCSYPWGAAYNSFGTTPGSIDFLHTLYVSSSFAIDASRCAQLSAYLLTLRVTV